MILVLKSARSKEGLNSSLRLRRVLLIGLLLENLKLVQKIKVFMQMAVGILETTQTMMRLIFQKLVHIRIILTMMRHTLKRLMKLGTTPMVLMLTMIWGFFLADIFDPRYWDSLDQKMVDILVQKDPKRGLLFRKVLKIDYPEGFLQHYTLEFYHMERSVIENDWYIPNSLIEFSIFFCKLLRKGHLKSQLTNEASMIGHMLLLDLKSMKLLQIILQIWPLGMTCISGLVTIKQLIKLLNGNLRKKKTIGGRCCSELF
ncbi:hypothetical protein BAE44_0021338 [Dichanthelium oligosanthes]|uniref:Uncharacterized protein n=1 Tax=Dichanthelium oligosanthes TaxID=888268 RepID=A0A1E5UXM6_9POAL|nr:hypothetical protein BAE44_0021338 [Dichanthelium oligosanthes]